MPFNPYALGHKVNHVPSGHKPNVLQVLNEYEYIFIAYRISSLLSFSFFYLKKR